MQINYNFPCTNYVLTLICLVSRKCHSVSHSWNCTNFTLRCTITGNRSRSDMPTFSSINNLDKRLGCVIPGNKIRSPSSLLLMYKGSAESGKSKYMISSVSVNNSVSRSSLQSNKAENHFPNGSKRLSATLFQLHFLSWCIANERQHAIFPNKSVTAWKVNGNIPVLRR